MTDTDTGMIPVRDHLAGGDPLPSDLATPRPDSRVALWMGIVVGGVLMVLDIGLFILAAVLPV